MTFFKFYSFLTFFAVTTVIIACNRQNSATENNPYNQYISHCDTIISLDDFKVFESQITAVKDSVVILSTEYVLYAYDLAEGKLNELITVGDGPNCVVDFTSIGLSETDNVWVYDGNVGKYITVRLDNLSKETVMMPKLRMLNELQPISDQRFIGVPYGKSVGYYLFNKEGEVIDSLAYFPPKPKNVSDWTHTFACSGHIAISADGHHFARSVAKDGGIDFFKYDNDRISHIARYAEFDMDYSTDGNKEYPVPVTTDKSGCGYYSVANTPDGFIALFSSSPIHENRDFAATEIHSFSNDGTLKNKIKLDFPITSIAFDTATNQVFGVSAAADDNESCYLIKFSI